MAHCLLFHDNERMNINSENYYLYFTGKYHRHESPSFIVYYIWFVEFNFSQECHGTEVEWKNVVQHT